MRIIWIVPLLAAAWATIELFSGISLATSAPQQAAAAAIAAAVAIIPYIGCRALQAFADASANDERNKSLEAIAESVQRIAIHVRAMRSE